MDILKETGGLAETFFDIISQHHREKTEYGRVIIPVDEETTIEDDDDIPITIFLPPINESDTKCREAIANNENPLLRPTMEVLSLEFFTDQFNDNK
ncbi:hypothetical protein L6259_01285 [Candidatus Parcubacteria bacterium]|nr:hypothetical protein [Patescibacteria group bacterium]MCG2693898.1 hypothetical protein [Candidatus Parcubacteria bacterium]